MEFHRSIWLPPLLAVAILLAYYVLVGETGFPNRTFLLLFLLVAFVVMAVITPLPLFIRKESGLSPWYPLALAFFCALILLGRFFLAGSIETYGGREFPHFEYRFPLLGNILDIVVISLGMRKIAYFPPGYEVILWAGLFIEIVLVSAIIYIAASWLVRQE